MLFDMGRVHSALNSIVPIASTFNVSTINKWRLINYHNQKCNNTSIEFVVKNVDN
jgi:hypothetical protein